jgi:hypothetical protein
MTAATKLRTLASADATLQSYFGTGIGTDVFRWFFIQLPPKYFTQQSPIPPTGGTVATLQPISAQYLYAQEAPVNLTKPRFQLVIRDPNVDTVDSAALAVINWLATVCFANDDQFQSPPITPRQFPNFVVSTRPGLDVQLKPPVPSYMIDFRIWNLGLL